MPPGESRRAAGLRPARLRLARLRLASLLWTAPVGRYAVPSQERELACNILALTSREAC